MTNDAWKDAQAAPAYETWYASLHREKSERTAEDYSRTVRDLLAVFPDKTADEFTTADCQRLLDGYPPGSRQARKFALRSFFQPLYLAAQISANPVDRVQVPTPRRRSTPDVFNDGEVARLYDLDDPDGQLFVLMIECGLRKRECRALRRREIDLERGYIAVRSRDEPHVPLAAAAQQAVLDLDAAVHLKAGDYLWSTRPGGGEVIRRDRPIANTTFQRWYRECLRQARVPHREARTTHRTFEHREKLKEAAFRVSAAEVQSDVATLTRLLSQANHDVRGYFDEAVTCLRFGALRAAVVFVWSAAMRTLHEAALSNGSSALNAALRKHDRHARTVTNIDDFGWIKDRTFLDACPDMGLLDKGQKTTLVGALDLRNSCGHPTKYEPGVKKVSAYIEDVASIVFR